jgi:Protein of unknown function (DUF1524)
MWPSWWFFRAWRHTYTRKNNKNTKEMLVRAIWASALVGCLVVVTPVSLAWGQTIVICGQEGAPQSQGCSEGPAGMIGDTGRGLQGVLNDAWSRAGVGPAAGPADPAQPIETKPTKEPGALTTGPAQLPVRESVGTVRDRSNPIKRPSPTFDLAAFGGWEDSDSDCLDTRAEVLVGLSKGTVVLRGDGCTIHSGRWEDPYTGQVLFDADEVYVDHLVPLDWAWRHGAWEWDDATRMSFANDPENLYAVDVEAALDKAGLDPSQWLPPDAAFHCAYANRFERIRRVYQIQLPLDEQRAIDRVRTEACEGRRARP